MPPGFLIQLCVNVCIALTKSTDFPKEMWLSHFRCHCTILQSFGFQTVGRGITKVKLDNECAFRSPECMCVTKKLSDLWKQSSAGTRVWDRHRDQTATDVTRRSYSGGMTVCDNERDVGVEGNWEQTLFHLYSAEVSGKQKVMMFCL